MWEPEVGNTVTLKSGEITILVRITSASAQAYEGEIVGFEQTHEYECCGRKPGDPIEFGYDNIFGCSR